MRLVVAVPIVHKFKIKQERLNPKFIIYTHKTIIRMRDYYKNYDLLAEGLLIRLLSKQIPSPGWLWLSTSGCYPAGCDPATA